MPRLLTFGGLSLTSPDGSGGTTPQRSRLALLAVLAAAGERGAPREKLLVLFWPDRAPEQARNALNQAVFVLRRDLGEDAISADPGTLRVNRQRIDSDIADFDAALERKDWETAAGLHVGPFLDGVYLRESPELERWIDQERARVLEGFRTAVTTLALAADGRGDPATSVGWWKRLVGADPLSSRAAIGYMSALAATGDRAAALDFARVHESLLRSELDVAVDSGVAALVNQLRADTSSATRDGSNGTQQSAIFSTAPRWKPGERTAVARERQRERVRRALARQFEILDERERSSLWTSFVARPLSQTQRVVLCVFHTSVVEFFSTDDLVGGLRRAADVRHPNILALTDAGSVDDVVYFCSELPPGPSLRDRFKHEPQLSIRDAIAITLDLAAALEAAHAKNVLHRDVKPRHVALGERALLQNVGVASVLATAGQQTGDRSAMIAVGTPAYLSPEQITGTSRVDERSDLFSLGCVFYQMLAGMPPFGDAAAPVTLSRRVAEAAPPLRRDGLPSAVSEIVMRTLARVPGDRFESAADLRAALLATGVTK